MRRAGSIEPITTNGIQMTACTQKGELTLISTMAAKMAVSAPIIRMPKKAGPSPCSWPVKDKPQWLHWSAIVEQAR